MRQGLALTVLFLFATSLYQKPLDLNEISGLKVERFKATNHIQVSCNEVLKPLYGVSSWGIRQSGQSYEITAYGSMFAYVCSTLRGDLNYRQTMPLQNATEMSFVYVSQNQVVKDIKVVER